MVVPLVALIGSGLGVKKAAQKMYIPGGQVYPNCSSRI